jgi:hypothetical protein
MTKIYPLLTSFHLLLFLFIGLESSCQQKGTYGPGSYDLSKPEKFVLPESLLEISGITFGKATGNIVYAHQDEDGLLFYFKPGEKAIKQVQFGKKGDYEDVAIVSNTVVILRSDGVLFTFPLSEVHKGKVNNVKKWEDLLPSGEYESLALDPKNNSLVVLCKVCKSDKEDKKTTGTVLRLGTDGRLTRASQFSIDAKKIAKVADKKKIHFQPSALTKNTLTNEWYIVASVNKLLVVMDEQWNPKSAFPLSPSIFLQPEGIAFDANNNLYISNEGDNTRAGNLLKFKPKH